MDKFRLPHAAAEKFYKHSVPSMFGPFARAILEGTSLPGNAQIIDIAFATGSVKREIVA